MKKINMKLLSAIMALMLLSGCGESAVSGSGQPSESTIESEVSSAVSSEETEKAAFTVRYGGEPYDPTSQEDQLSLAVLKSTTKEIRYTYLEGSVKQIMKAENCHKESTASGTPYDKRMKI